MPITTRAETVVAHDGGSFLAHTAVPEAGTGPGIVLLQEALGVNGYVKQVAARLAEAGYVVLAPDIYWRLEPGVSLEREEDFGEAMSYLSRLDFDLAVTDGDATLAHLRGMSECTGKAGGLGFCLGGRLAYGFAARSSPDAVVSYYGVGIDEALGEASDIRCPTLLHFGETDPFIPPDAVTRIKDAFAGRADIEIETYDAGHAFDNHFAASMHAPAAAADAWRRTMHFLGVHLGAG